MDIVVYFLLFTLMVFLSLRFFTRRTISRLPEGPVGLPLIGNALQLWGKPLHKELQKWSEIHGDFFSYKVGRNNVVVLSSPETLQELCVKRGNLYSSRPRLSKQADLCTNNDRIVNMPYSDKWRKHRKVVHQLLGTHNSKIFKPYQEFESRVMLGKVLEAPQNFYKELARYSGSVTFSLLLGARFPTAENPIVHRIGPLMEDFFNHISYGAWLVDWIPILDSLPDMLAPWRAKARDYHHQHMKFWLVFYTQMKQRVANGIAPDCFTTRLLKETDISNFTDGEAAALMADLLTAGSETTATSLQWLFKAITMFPDFVLVAQKELDSVVGSERLPDWDDQPKLPYISAVINELHRWASAAPVAFHHCTIADDSYRGRSIPKGTVVVPLTCAIHHDESLFPDHDAFVPERWLPKTDSRYTANSAAKIDEHFAFGIGRRACPGQHVANASLFIGISRLLWAFHIRPKGGAVISHDTVGSLPVLGPAPFECEISPRSSVIAEVIQKGAVNSSNLEDADQYEKLLAEVL